MFFIDIIGFKPIFAPYRCKISIYYYIRPRIIYFSYTFHVLQA